MKLFGLNFEDFGSDFEIEENHKNWADDVLFYLMEVFGVPTEESKTVLLDLEFFPKTLLAEEAQVEDTLHELCVLLKLDPHSIDHVFYEDLLQEETTVGLFLPYEIDTKFLPSGPQIILKKQLLKNPKKFIFLLLYELLQISLVSRVPSFKVQAHMGPFMVLVSTYLGFGILATRNLFSVGSWNQLFWESKWFQPNLLATECMAYFLALLTRIKKEENPAWKILLTDELRTPFEKALRYVDTLSPPFQEKLRFQVTQHMEESSSLYKKRDYKGAVVSLKKLIEKNPETVLPARVYGNLGYYLNMDEQYQESLPMLKKALEIDAHAHFVHDSMAYAFLHLGQLKKGKKCISASLKGMKNDIAYSFRNLALYHKGKGEIEKAQEFFDLSYENSTQGVDLLDFHYAEFLFEQGKKKKAMKHLKKEVERGEPMAIKKMETLS